MGRNRVKPEQASKVLMRMPTRRSFGEGRTCGEAIGTRTHAIRRGSGHGTPEGWFVVTGGDPSRTDRRVGIRIRTFEACSGFTFVTAHRIAQQPKAAFVAGLRPSQLPNRAAR